MCYLTATTGLGLQEMQRNSDYDVSSAVRIGPYPKLSDHLAL